MTDWTQTDEASTFILTGDSRETSPETMEAIAFFAHNLQEAEDLWNGDFRGRADFLAIWEHATNNGACDVDLSWGGDGGAWATMFEAV